jgi:hypothetical protein
LARADADVDGLTWVPHWAELPVTHCMFALFAQPMGM